MRAPSATIWSVRATWRSTPAAISRSRSSTAMRSSRNRSRSRPPPTLPSSASTTTTAAPTLPDSSATTSLSRSLVSIGEVDNKACLCMNSLEERLDTFSLVADERLLVANILHAMVFTQVPRLASAAEYFFKLGVEGKMICPTIGYRHIDCAQESSL